ncbi:UDP-N-acetylmuramoyl-tripeptide--D-alanyl-D-alanine ligase [Mesobaculum littorinae]|uniref:UDP-N-acetylmuramoyl-tripeptide--D-alanyl-D-alanine ligase n=1 Tax=Mesobaculum littorinae TaxID=2486419 RepID=A0A438AIZ2_9RHOB|nr:UDP-N-acetylmuramoyl-tripeptide--D-alanyl-D-alanine ligase [Mesobaculum littorinae]RVV98680.1 UDP-N-acetylmuramoyl-tripeptide--D-alanyl-D-alanine ligase [Mesobaculum littorinae]
MTPLWTAAEAAAATGGTATTDWTATGVSIDTRSLQPGDLFVALADVRDGHDFVAQALARGAAAALVSRRPDGVAENAPLLVVDDVLPALEALGRAGRNRSAARVVAVTGSVGKTSTKEMLRTALAGQGPIHAAEKSFNNHWGVPLTLARLPQDAAYAIIEIGMNHPGEIAPLARLARPHVAMITTVAAAHLEAFENIEGIAREKASIFDGLEPGGLAVVNGDLPTTPILVDAARAAGARIVTFGEGRALHHRVTEISLASDSTTARARAWRTPLLLKVATPGRHFAVNALGVLAVVRGIGADRARALCNLAAWVPPEGRGLRETLVLDEVDDHLRFDLIDDAFNANPSSMAAALDTLAAAEPTDGLGRVSRGRRIAVLGDMLELGDTERDLHAALADLPAMTRIAQVHCVGPRMQALHDALPEDKRGEWVEDATTLAARAHQLADAGDIVLVKGSKGSRVSLVVDAIRKLGHRVAHDG